MTWDGGSAAPIDPHQAEVDARTVLLQSVHSNNPLTRMHAIEAIARTMGAKEGRVLMQGLNDPVVGVRYAAAMAVGDVTCRSAIPRLVEIVENPKSDQRVVAAAVYALHRMGDNRYTGQLAILLHSELDEGRSAAATVMGKMTETSAIGPLKSMLADEKAPAVRLAIVEALARLGDKRSQQMLESFSKQYFLDLRLAVVPTIGELRVAGASRILRQLLGNSKNPPRVRVAAVGALGTLGVHVKDAEKYARQALENPDGLLRDFYGQKHAVTDVERSSLRQIAAMALGKIGNDQIIPVLQLFLEDQDSAVRVAAAMAILQLLSPQVSVEESPQAAPAPPSATPAGTRPRIHAAEGMDEFKAK